jgi:hypothetical protein
LDQNDNLGLKAPSCQDTSAIGHQDQTGSEIPEGSEIPSKETQSDNPEISTSIPVPKRYAHHGKRRRSYTDELFRCQFTDMISRTPLICNHLLWRNKPAELREHLKEHLDLDLVNKLTDSEVSQRYSEAKRIFLEGIPEDLDEDEGEETSE